jgi:glucokinase
MKNLLVLAVDVGGTHTRAAIAASDGGRCTIERERVYASADWPGLLPLLRDFLVAGDQRPARGCIAVAGPITDNGARARVTNLPWHLDRAQLQTDLGCEGLALINDFAAVGHGIAALGADNLVTLQAGEAQPRAPRAVLGAGTGLGQALLVRDGDGYAVLATEGGHVDFAPQSELQWELWRALHRAYGHVSYERLVSGPGLVFIYRFLHERHGGRSEDVTRLAPEADPAAAIAGAALAGSDPLAASALDEFVRIYGAQAGNLALNCLPFGGLYVAGGIAPKMLAKLREEEFLAAFNAKGRMEAVTQRIPVHIVTHPNPGLLGAALYAGRF